jgi:tripartite-type tricarboxylate transporter receptor subunit TctC
MTRLPQAIGLVAGAWLALAASSALADPVADFYRGKTLYIVIGGSIGGEYDSQARLIGRHLGKYIPGNPTIVPQNMVGAGGLNVANNLYTIAPKDGTTLGVIGNNLPALQASGGDGIRFDTAKFQWLGSVAPQVETMAVWSASGVKTIDDARRGEVIVGAVSRGSMSYFLPAMLNELLGTRFKIVTGYDGQGSINLAMERGEVEGRENTWSGWKMAEPGWVSAKQITILLQAGPRAADLPAVPSVEALAKSEDDRELIALIMSGTEFGRPLVAPPGVPGDRVQALRDAFRAMAGDPDFLADAASTRIEVNATDGEHLQAVVDQVLSTPKPLAQRAREYLE